MFVPEQIVYTCAECSSPDLFDCISLTELFTDFSFSINITEVVTVVI